MKVLLVEDDELLAGVVAEFLTDHLHVVEVVTDGESAWNQISALEYDLILLDVMLPKLDGIRLCQRLRSHGYSVPVLMITARDTSTDKVLGLDAGADDYMVKPLDFPELLARIRALLRRGSSVSSPILEWGELHLDPATYEVSYQDNTLRLTPKEYKLLELLLRNGRRILSRNTIIERLWSFENPPEEGTVKTHIKSLRKKLKIVGAPTNLIETVHGIGYRLKELT
ncbi:response regulator transcription factor [Microcoleus sp. FACHB-53]|jgi:DNA-binding response OmpR family regulator|nr:response regulator transcription factor [Microcoleus sp. FACHB-53]MBD2129266.1 response regulator transcription factor [Microcoleus sp. FACHB-1]